MKSPPPNWRSFYEALGFVGPDFLTGLTPDLKEYIEFESHATDSFWSESLEEILNSLWDENPEVAVQETVKEWATNVKEHLVATFSPENSFVFEAFKINPDIGTELQRSVPQIGVTFRPKNGLRLIDSLIYAAKEPQDQDKREVVADILIQGVIQPYKKHVEGELIRAIEIPWRKIIDHLGSDWNLAFQISPRQWEELIAAAFHQEKYDEVILTPRSGDHGRDVIAIKNGVGSVRIINSVKAYKPGKLVRYDDVRALAGVLLGDPKATKGIITTTSDFPPNINKDPYISSLLPYRLELMNGTKLKRWLADIARRSAK